MPTSKDNFVATVNNKDTDLSVMFNGLPSARWSKGQTRARRHFFPTQPLSVPRFSCCAARLQENFLEVVGSYRHRQYLRIHAGWYVIRIWEQRNGRMKRKIRAKQLSIAYR